MQVRICAVDFFGSSRVAGVVAAVAQWIEYRPPKPRVVGSIPASRANLKRQKIFKVFFKSQKICYNRNLCGGMPEWLKGQTVNLLAYAYTGSNPSPLHHLLLGEEI